ncbi:MULTISPECIES: hypothetical protein [unclassified Clostridium]|uniref:hypothetical protein n=1 Tax=unclassified Clostridium TaxID=2614128 RepID=UPI003216C6D6
MLNNNEFFYYDENNEQDYSAEMFAQDFRYGQPDGVDFEQESFRGKDGNWGHDCKPSHHRPCPPCPRPCPPCPKPCPPCPKPCPPCPRPCPPCHCQCSSGDDWWIILILLFCICPFGGFFW